MPDTLIKGYEELENKFLKRVEKDRELLSCDDIVYLPAFLKPTRKVKYVFISMEPSLTKEWAPDRNKADAQIEGGFRNFAPSRFEDAILHYCAQKYLLTDYKGYYITDMSKGARPPQKANSERIRTWLNWFQLLKEELELVAEEDAQIFTIGKKVHDFLLGKTQKKKIPPENIMEYKCIVNWIETRFRGKLKYLPHHSPMNKKYWGTFINEKKLKNAYAKYILTEDDLLAFTKTLLYNTNSKITCMEGLQEKKLNESLKKMAFVYKMILTPYRIG